MAVNRTENRVLTTCTRSFFGGTPRRVSVARCAQLRGILVFWMRRVFYFTFKRRVFFLLTNSLDTLNENRSTTTDWSIRRGVRRFHGCQTRTDARMPITVFHQLAARRKNAEVLIRHKRRADFNYYYYYIIVSPPVHPPHNPPPLLTCLVLS